MRRYDLSGKNLVEVICNNCGKVINVKNGVMMEEVLSSTAYSLNNANLKRIEKSRMVID